LHWQLPDWHDLPVEQALLHDPQCWLEVCRSGWFWQVPHWLLAVQDWVPPSQVPQAREPLRH